jgi:hypothetical protein
LWHGTAISPQLTQITQPNGQILSEDSAGFESFASPSIQAGGFIWNVHTIGINGYARIRLYKLDTSASVTTPLLVFTPKNTTPANEHLFNASFATSSWVSKTPAFITETRTIPSSSRTGRATTVTFAGLNSSSNDTDWSVVSLGQSPAQFTTNCPCAWGIYSATQVDPSNPNRAWGFSQLATGVNQTDWTVRAGEVARSP